MKKAFWYIEYQKAAKYKRRKINYRNGITVRRPNLIYRRTMF